MKKVLRGGGHLTTILAAEHWLEGKSSVSEQQSMVYNDRAVLEHSQPERMK